MASLNNITLTPDSGTGTKSLTVSASAYTGRVNRSTKFTASNSSLGVTSTNSLVVTQTGHEIFLVDSSIIASDATSATVHGVSNLQSIRITGDLDNGLWNYLSYAAINGVTVSKAALSQSQGYSIPNDPGKAAQYNLSFVFTEIPESVSDVTYNGYINGSSSLKVTVTKRGTGVVTNDIWFSNGESSSSTTSPVNITLGADGDNDDDIRINTNPDTLSWTITASNN